MIRTLFTLLCIYLLTACHVPDLYPVGKTNGVATVRYARNLPMFILMPDLIPAEGAPIVIFNHGRPFTNPSSGNYAPQRYQSLVTLLNQNGIAVALPVRSGYFSAPGPDDEEIPCNSPGPYDFKRAGKAAAQNIRAAVEFVKSLPNINRGRIFVGGTSAGGFGAISAIPVLSEEIRGVFSLNGGRCGDRGDVFNGLAYVQDIYQEIARQSHVPVVFFTGTKDTTIPMHSTQRLYESFCAGRGHQCTESVYFVIAEGADHRVSAMVRVIGEKIVRFVQHGAL